jgi:hypothetical protein
VWEVRDVHRLQSLVTKPERKESSVGRPRCCPENTSSLSGIAE